MSPTKIKGAVEDEYPPGIMDLTLDDRVVQFLIKPDVFYGPTYLPAENLLLFVEKYGQLMQADDSDRERTMSNFKDLFDIVLQPDSAKKFITRMSDPEHPITLAQGYSSLIWLMGEYGMRPIAPSNTSADGSDESTSGTSSMDSTSPEESTSGDSPPTGS